MNKIFFKYTPALCPAYTYISTHPPPYTNTTLEASEVVGKLGQECTGKGKALLDLKRKKEDPPPLYTQEKVSETSFKISSKVKEDPILPQLVWCRLLLIMITIVGSDVVDLAIFKIIPINCFIH